MTLPLIGLAGRKQHGKNTAARALVDVYGYTEAAYADPLRDMLWATNPIVGHEMHGPYKVVPVSWREAIEALGYEEAKERYPELRRVMQDFGTGGVREVLGDKYGLEELLDASPWVAIAERRIEKATEYISIESYDNALLRNVHHWREHLVFTDVRFPNEADLIRKHGGKIIRVVRPGLPIPEEEHESESALDDYAVDHVLVNDGSVEKLHDRILGYLA